MEPLEGEHFDTVVIGAGMSGLAAGIRLALFGKKVIILEKHNVLGGLNSFYSFEGRKYDVGLHALTNYSKPGTKGSPLAMLLRQLRIRREELDLAEQNYSRIAFPSVDLKFSCDFGLFESEIAKNFPQEIDGFRKLVKAVNDEFGKVSENRQTKTTRSILDNFVQDPLLQDMILLPVMSYGSAQERDIDWDQFVTLFKSIFLEGLCRPYEGVRAIIRILKDKFKEFGGIRKMKCGVKEIVVKDGKVKNLILDSGETITADNVISSIGTFETRQICTNYKKSLSPESFGKITFVESQIVFNAQPKDFGWDETIIFYNDSERLNFRCPEDLLDPTFGVICFPNNYKYSNNRMLPEGVLRVTTLGNYDVWNNLSPEEYKYKKLDWVVKLRQKSLKYLKSIDESKLDAITLATDMFTPVTIKKYTNHINGSVYGAPNKNRTGKTELENLFICGTDQGFLGITGAMISGIAMANQHILSKS